MTIEIPDQLLHRSGLTKEEVLLELAILLFQRERITLGQANMMAGLHQFKFQKELAKRKITIHYDLKDLEQDLEPIKHFGG